MLAASGVWAGQQVSLFAPTLEWANFPRRADLHVSQAIGCRIRMRVEPGLRSSGSLDRRRGGSIRNRRQQSAQLPGRLSYLHAPRRFAVVCVWETAPPLATVVVRSPSDESP